MLNLKSHRFWRELLNIPQTDTLANNIICFSYSTQAVMKATHYQLEQKLLQEHTTSLEDLPLIGFLVGSLCS